MKLIFPEVLKYFPLSNLFALLAKLLGGMPVKMMTQTKEKIIQRLVFRISINFGGDIMALTIYTGKV